MKNYFFLIKRNNSMSFTNAVNTPTKKPTYNEATPIIFNVVSSVNIAVENAITDPLHAEIIPTTGCACKYVTIIL